MDLFGYKKFPKKNMAVPWPGNLFTGLSNFKKLPPLVPAGISDSLDKFHEPELVAEALPGLCVKLFRNFEPSDSINAQSRFSLGVIRLNR